MNKICEFSVDTDVKNIYCNLENCKIIVTPTEDNRLGVKYAKSAKINVACNSTDLVINQKSKLSEKLFSKTPRIEISVPEHLIVALSVSGKRAQADFEGGIYDEIEFSAASGSLSLFGVAAKSVTVTSKACECKISESTVKDKIIAGIECGNFTTENCFAAHVNCHINSGNAGAVNLNCRDSIFEVAAGNVNATVLGDEKTFKVIVNAKCGTCNKESVNIEGELGVFKAYADCGNIHVEFIEPEKFTQPEEEIQQ